MTGCNCLKKVVVISHYNNYIFRYIIPNVMVLPRLFRAKFESKVKTIITIIVNTCRLLFINKKYDAYVATSLVSAIPLLLISKIKHTSDKKYVFTNFYLHQLGEKKIIINVLSFLFNKRDVTIILQSKHEKKVYTSIYPGIKAVFVPFCQNPTPTSNVRQGDYVFSGGYTNRDYDTLLRCASKTPNIRYIIACSRLNKIKEHIPANVQIIRDIPKKDFDELLEGSKVVVMNLKDEVGASGQMVALSAMSLSKAVIYANFDTISYYFKDNYSGLSYKPGDHTDLKEKILYLFKHDQKRAKISKNNYNEYISKFTMMNYLTAVTELISSEVCECKKTPA